MRMTQIEFMKRKNAILAELTGITLIPENEMVEIPEIDNLPLLVNPKNLVDSDVCTYCIRYEPSNAYNKVLEEKGIEFNSYGCDLCPLSSKCNDVDRNDEDGNSRYRKVISALPETMVSVGAIQELVKEYNKGRE